MLSGEYSNSKKDGNWLWKDLSGKIIKDQYFKEGMQQGEEKIYYKNGKLKIQVNYLNDEVTGDYRYWSEDGELKGHKIYRESELIKTIKSHLKKKLKKNKNYE
jgi:antitoxin component YwqK of YwqJK toxin-antitoxin module